MRTDEEKMHELARAFMDAFPETKPMSLDEWFHEYMDELSEPQKRACSAILSLFDEAEDR